MERGQETAQGELTANWIGRDFPGYPKEYAGPRPIHEQVLILNERFGLPKEKTLSFLNGEFRKLKLPEGAEGWFAIVSPAILESRLLASPSDSYELLTNFTLDEIGRTRSFFNVKSGELTRSKFRMHEHTAIALGDILEHQDGSEILIVPAQLGKRHHGLSVDAVRERFFTSESEFGMPSFAAACIAITHPERFVTQEEIDMKLPGDEFSSCGTRYSRTPALICMHVDRVRYCTVRNDQAGDGSSPASLFRYHTN